MNKKISKINYSQLMGIDEYSTKENQLIEYCSTYELSNTNKS